MRPNRAAVLPGETGAVFVDLQTEALGKSKRFRGQHENRPNSFYWRLMQRSAQTATPFRDNHHWPALLHDLARSDTKPIISIAKPCIEKQTAGKKSWKPQVASRLIKKMQRKAALRLCVMLQAPALPPATSNMHKGLPAKLLLTSHTIMYYSSVPS